MNRFLLPTFGVLCGAMMVARAELRVAFDEDSDTVMVTRDGASDPILQHVAKPDFRPYIHPLAAPDGQGVMTQYSPDHHRHQTGVYWGFTRVNGRDYFHHPEGDYWRRIDVEIGESEGDPSWRLQYGLLDEDGETVMIETQEWVARETSDGLELDLVWRGAAETDLTIGEYDYGGLFVRMPWEPGMDAEVENAARQKNAGAEGKRAMWLDVGMTVEGREDRAHIAILDHPENPGFPQTWRVDAQFGVGPASTRQGDWKIAEGESETVRHRLIIYTGELDSAEVTDKWKAYSGQGGTWALWGIAQREGREAEFLTPERAVEEMTVTEGFDVNVFAGEPIISQPMAFCWDHQGRLWIAENLDYESRGDGFSNDGNSRIAILEDTDRDGVADSKKIFLEGIPFPAGIAVGFDGLWLGAPPHLLFVPDKDQDDKADWEDIEIRLTGWGIRDRHETLNSFRWGPDGWLYGTQGFATPSNVRKPSEDEAKLFSHKDPFPEDILEGPGEFIDGGVWRYHPTKEIFEVVAHGFSNPWGIDFDAKGQCFITACVIPHLWHVNLGGIYHRQGGRHINPYVYSDIRTIADHRHRSAHGGARVYMSDAFPEKYQGQIFMANIHEHAVLTDKLERSGSGFIGRHGEDFLLANNAQWVGFSMEIGPGGNVYALDWHDADICGKDVLNKDTGRVFRVAPKASLAKNWEGRYADLKTLSDEALVRLQSSPSAWHWNRARVVLQERAVAETLEDSTAGLARQYFEGPNSPDLRLRALWTLHVIGAAPDAFLANALGDRDEYIRAWAIQLLMEDRSVDASTLSTFERMARTDPSAVVRLYLASALGRADLEDRWALAEGLMGRAEDIDDHNIPKMIWFGIEPLVPADPDRALRLARSSDIPMLQRFIARRALDARELGAVVDSLAAESDVPTLVNLLDGAIAGAEGKNDWTLPEAWDTAFAKLSAHPRESVRESAIALGQRLGDRMATDRLLQLMVNDAVDIEARSNAMRSLANQHEARALPAILESISGGPLQATAIRSAALYQDERVTQALFNAYGTMDSSLKNEAILTLASRMESGRALTEAIRDGDIPRDEIPAYAVRQLHRVVGPSFTEVWGPIDAGTADKAALYDRYRDLFSEDHLADADLASGKEVFQRVCASCHKLHGEGGEVGPDITGANRGDLEYLLSNILEPSGVIQDDYKMVLINTRDGRTVAGNVINETERDLTLRMIGQDVRIAKSEIQSRETMPYSMMPEGLLLTLSEQEAINLIGYLQSSAPVQE